MITAPFLSLTQRQLAITRATGQDTYVNGRLVPAPTTTLNIWATVTPYELKHKENTLFNEDGDRSRQALKVYTQTPLRQRVDGANGWAADTFVWVDGWRYMVDDLAIYNMNILNHCRAICYRVELI